MRGLHSGRLAEPYHGSCIAERCLNFKSLLNSRLSMPSKAFTSSTAAQSAKLTPQEVPAAFQRYRTELQNLAQKIGELESEMEEHA